MEYKNFLEVIWKKFEQYKDSGTIFNLKDHLWTLFLYEKGLFKIPEESAPDAIYDGCHCGDCHFTIQPNGNVMACRRFESVVGNLFQKPLHELWDGDEMEQYRQYEKFEKCSLIEKGKIRPVIAECFPFDKISEAHLLAEQRGQIGKIVVTLPD